MKHRSHLPVKERTARSKLSKLVHDKPFVTGSLVKMTRTCGKATCKCMKGDKHVSWYLATRHKAARKMICIPRAQEQEVKEWVNTYQEITKHIDTVSQQCLERLAITDKRERRRDS
jgi:hypothetical protein